MDRRSNPNSADSSSHRSSQFFIDMASSHTLEDLPGPAVREVCDKTKDENENKDHAVIPIGVEDHFRLQERGSAEDPERCNESSCFMREISIPGSASHTLPIPIPDPLPDFIPVLCGEPCQPAGAALTPTISNADPRQRKFNILVVDDSKLNRKMLVKSLKTESHSCDEAEDGLEAVRMVTRRSESRTSEGIHVNSYDAILMDFMMPIMDGPTATEILRDMGYTGVIIGVTGNALPSDVEYFTVKGADKVLLKPVDVDVLLLTVHSLLSQC